MDRDGGKFDASRVITSTDRRAIDQLSQELEEQRELAANRLAELVRLELITYVTSYFRQVKVTNLTCMTNSKS